MKPQPNPGQKLLLEKRGSAFDDPAFASNKTLPIHRWVPWIAGFASSFVRDALNLSGGENRHTILDPFCGVGTALVETVLHGDNAIGFEINPYAALASRVKVSAYQIPLEALQGEIANFQRFYADKISSNYLPKSQSPKGFKTRSEFYSPRVLHKVAIALDFIQTIDNPRLKDLFRLAFASTMVLYSNYSYEPSLSRRVTAGKAEILDFPVEEAIIGKLREMAEDIAWYREQLSEVGMNGDRQPRLDCDRDSWQKHKIIQDSFFRYSSYLEPESVDSIVTSPPYLNNYHYNRNTRPQLYWLGFAQKPQDLKHLETANFGKFWQTVRGQERIDLEFALPNTDLGDRLETIRGLNPEKGIYGGSGWANYAASYFNDCYRLAKGIVNLLKPGGTALVVVGNSILQGVSIPTDQYFGKIAESVGLELVRIEIPRATRVGNSIIRSDVRVGKAKKSQKLYEAIVELRK
ncbi:MAG: site-specific DNA-methyltransferase [Oscillatoria sp. SIO1A7]|nr:site-specific DNA-methyltransferase [Oscillatoria sp. SIO1A7]